MKFRISFLKFNNRSFLERRILEILEYIEILESKILISKCIVYSITL